MNSFIFVNFILTFRTSKYHDKNEEIGSNEFMYNISLLCYPLENTEIQKF